MGGNVLIPVVVLIVPFIFVIIIEWFKSQERCKRYDLQANLYAKALEKGQSIPADVFAKPIKPEKIIYKPLHIGIICMAISIGISLMFWIMSISFARFNANASKSLISVASVGAIPFLIGIAFFIIHFIEKKKDAGKNDQ